MVVYVGGGGGGAYGGVGGGANTWKNATSLPAAAGAAGSHRAGGNAGLVIFTYTAASCPL